MNKFFNILITITLVISVMAFGREGSFSGGGYDYSSSYSPSYSSDWGSSSSSSSSDWGGSSWSSSSSNDSWGFSSNDDDDNYHYHHTHHYDPPKYYLYELYGINCGLAEYYVNKTNCLNYEKNLWNNTLCSYNNRYEKGKQPAQTQEVKEFIIHLNEVRPKYNEYCKKKNEEAKQAFKSFLIYFLMPFGTLVLTMFTITTRSSNKK